MERVIAALVRVTGKQPRQVGSGYVAQCPAHEDRKPSLSLGRGTDGRVLVNCRAGCPTEGVLDCLGLSFRDLFEEGR